MKDSVPDVARSYRDDLAKIRDDPLFAIKQQEKKARERILDNPLKVAEFKKELEDKRKRKAERKEAKKAKKESKKAHKHSRDRGEAGSRDASPSRCLLVVRSEPQLRVTHGVAAGAGARQHGHPVRIETHATRMSRAAAAGSLEARTGRAGRDGACGGPMVRRPLALNPPCRAESCRVGT